MQTINLVNILGNLGADAESTELPNNKFTTTLSVATNTGYGENQQTQWHTVKLWGEPAKAAAKLKKGDSVDVTGYIDYRTWEDKKSNQKRTSPEIHSQDFIVLSNPKKTKNQANILGHVGKNVEVKQFGNKTKATLSVATNTGYGDNQKTQWHTIIFWDKAAEVVSKLKKGDVIFVSGTVEYRAWEDKETKQKRYSTEITAQQFSIVVGEVGKVSAHSPANAELEDIPY